MGRPYLVPFFTVRKQHGGMALQVTTMNKNTDNVHDGTCEVLVRLNSVKLIPQVLQGLAVCFVFSRHQYLDLNVEPSRRGC